MKTALFAALVATFTSTLWAEIPEGFLPAEESVSPSGRFAVIAPDFEHGSETNANTLVELESGAEIYRIKGTTGYQQMNHGGLYGAWTPDENYLLWTVDGKWFPRALTLIQTPINGKKARQLDLLSLCQKEMLKRTRKAYPKEYKATKNAGGMGSAYPDGFTIMFDYDPRQVLSFPLVIQLELTNDPKLLADVNPEFAARLLQGKMTATVSPELKVSFSNFELQGP